MNKIETPKVTEENPFVKEGKLDSELIAKFQEALKTDAAKDYDFNKEFNVTAVPDINDLPKDTTTPVTTTEVPETDDVEVKKWIGIYENAHDALKEAGYKFETSEPVTSKMSEAQQAVNARLDKLAEVKYKESKNSVLETDKDFPVEIVDKLSGIAPEDKAMIMAAFKEVAIRGTDATKKLQDELTAANTKLEDPKFSQLVEQGPKSGKDRVEAMRAHFGGFLSDEGKKKD